MENATTTIADMPDKIDIKRAVFAVVNVAVIGFLVVLAPGIADEFMANDRVAAVISETFSIQVNAIVPEMFTAAALLAAGAYLALLAARQVNDAFLAPLAPQHFTPMGRSQAEAVLHWISAAMVSFSVCARIGTVFQYAFIGWLGFSTDPGTVMAFAVGGCALSILVIVIVERLLAKHGVRRPLLNWVGAVLAMSFWTVLLAGAATAASIGFTILFLVAAVVFMVSLIPALLFAALRNI